MEEQEEVITVEELLDGVGGVCWHGVALLLYSCVILLLGLSWLVGVGDTNNCDCQCKALWRPTDCSRSIEVIREHKARQSLGAGRELGPLRPVEYLQN